jgi:hypothetical protein
MTERTARGGSIVPSTPHRAPAAPAIRAPTCTATLTVTAPGEARAKAVISRISSWVSQPSSSTNRLCIKGMMTNPPPKVRPLRTSIEENNFQQILPILLTSFIPILHREFTFLKYYDII